MNKIDLSSIIISAVCLAVILAMYIITYANGASVSIIGAICGIVVGMCFGSNVTIAVMHKKSEKTLLRP